MNKKIFLQMLVLVVLMLEITSIAVRAHTPGAGPAPEVELNPLIINDDGTEIEISLDDLGNYHQKLAKEQKRKSFKKENPNATDAELDTMVEAEFNNTDGKCLCVCASYRSMALAFSEVWDDEIPERKNIKIESKYVSVGSCQVMQYVVGNVTNVDPAPKSQGEFHIMLADGEFLNRSIKDLKAKSKNNKANMWEITVTDMSSNNSYTAKIEQDFWPEINGEGDFWKLRSKIKFSIPEAPTQADNDLWVEKYTEARDNLLMLEDWEMFEGIEKPPLTPMELLVEGIAWIFLISMVVGFAILVVLKGKSFVTKSAE